MHRRQYCCRMTPTVRLKALYVRICLSVPSSWRPYSNCRWGFWRHGDNVHPPQLDVISCAVGRYCFQGVVFSAFKVRLSGLQIAWFHKKRDWSVVIWNVINNLETVLVEVIEEYNEMPNESGWIDAWVCDGAEGVMAAATESRLRWMYRDDRSSPNVVAIACAVYSVGWAFADVTIHISIHTPHTTPTPYVCVIFTSTFPNICRVVYHSWFPRITLTFKLIPSFLFASVAVYECRLIRRTSYWFSNSCILLYICERKWVI